MAIEITTTLVQPSAPGDITRRWDAQYGSNADESKQAIGAQLKSLGPNCTREQIEEIIGNRSWTRITCRGCSLETDKLVRLSDDHNAYCVTCLHRGLVALGEE